MILIKKKNNSIEKDDFWIGFSDLMTGLMLVFIIISLVFVSKAQEDKQQMRELIKKAKKAKDKLDEIKKNIIVILSDKLKDKNIKIKYDKIKGTITISQDILFEKKKSNLNTKGKYLIIIFSKILNKNIFSNKEYRDLIKYIHIEGYASKEGDDNSNFNISFKRSKNVWKYMTYNDLKYNEVMKKKLNIVSRGEIDANQNKIDSSDRKVVFRFEFYDTYSKIFDGLSK